MSHDCCYASAAIICSTSSGVTGAWIWSTADNQQQLHGMSPCILACEGTYSMQAIINGYANRQSRPWCDSIGQHINMRLGSYYHCKEVSVTLTLLCESFFLDACLQWNLMLSTSRILFSGRHWFVHQPGGTCFERLSHSRQRKVASDFVGATSWFQRVNSLNCFCPLQSSWSPVFCDRKIPVWPSGSSIEVPVLNALFAWGITLSDLFVEDSRQSSVLYRCTHG